VTVVRRCEIQTVGEFLDSDRPVKENCVDSKHFPPRDIPPIPLDVDAYNWWNEKGRNRCQMKYVFGIVPEALFLPRPYAHNV
jgi:hypothetical protein